MVKKYSYSRLPEGLIHFSSYAEIPVIYSCDDRYVDLTIVSMISVVENTSCSIKFKILYSSLTDKSINILKSISLYTNCDIEFTKISEEIFSKFQNAHWVTIHAWFRVLIPNLYKNFDKAVYLDCDTMLRGDISEFYKINLSDNYVAAQNECTQQKNIERLKLDNKDYFNSGVLLINCKKWRDENLFDKIKYVAENNELAKCGDQDVLNIVIKDKKIIVKENIIYIETWFWPKYCRPDSFNTITRDNSLIVHFTSKKPNNPLCFHSLKNEWWEYAKKSNFYLDIIEKYRKESDKLMLEYRDKDNQ